MKPQFVKTANYRAFGEAIARIERRGAREACWLLISGAPGRGKSNIAEGWAAQAGAIFLRANQGWTPNAFMRALAGELKISDAGPGDKLFERILGKLASLGFPRLVVDEVQNCFADGAAVLEKLRDFTDRTNSIVVLVAGKDGVLTQIKQHPQVASRIGENVEFQLATVEDVTLIAKQLADVEIKPDLIARIHSDAKGVLRLVMNAISAVEEIAKNNGAKSIDAAQIKQSGASLCVDWQGPSARKGA